MANETQALETTETSNEVTTGGEQTNAGGGESSDKNKATGNFLSDLLNTEEDGEGEDGGEGTETEGSDEGTETADEGEDELEDIEVSTKGDNLAVGDKVTRGGKPVISGEVKLEDGTILKTDAKGNIAEIIEGDGGENGSDEGLFELKTGDDIEKYDLKKKEDLEKVREFAQKGRFFEKEQQAFKQKESEFETRIEQHETRETAMAYNLLYLQANGKLNHEEFEEKPYEDFIGASERRDKDGNVVEESTPEGDRRLWNAHKKQVADNVKAVTDYAADFKKTSEGYRKIVSDFGAKHPEIKDVKAWINENLGKYSAPILTFGKAQYPEDMLEMVYHWQNRDKIEKEIREDERRKKAKVAIKKDKGVKRSGEEGKTAADEFIDNGIFSKYQRKIVS